MKTYKIVLSNTDPIIISEEELKGVMAGLQHKGFVITKMGIFNSSYVIAIVPNQLTVNEQEWWEKKFQAPSEFAKLLSPKMKMLNYEGQTKAIEEFAKEERKLR
jgi:hypothetical protein